MQKQYKNILVVNLVNLGDVVFSTASLAILRQAYPQAKITYMARPNVIEVLQAHPDIDNLLAYEYTSKGSKLAVWKFAQQLKAYAFDLAISLDRRPRTNIILWLAGIPERIGAEKLYSEKTSWASIFNTQTIKLDYKLDERLQYENYQEFIRRFTGVQESYLPKIASAPLVNRSKVEDLLGEKPLGYKRLVLCVRAIFPLKNWPAEKFAELLTKIQARYLTEIVVIGTSADYGYAQNIIDQSGVKVNNLCGKTELLDLIAVYNLSDLMLTIDNGAAHLAAATSLPIVSIFGPTTPVRARPASPISESVYLALPCSPCLQQECSTHKCMQEITVEQVLGALERVWEKL